MVIHGQGAPDIRGLVRATAAVAAVPARYPIAARAHHRSSEIQCDGAHAEATSPNAFPAFGRSDFDIFENIFLEVMQFVSNHTTLQADDEVDREFLAAVEPLGIVPGREFDPDRVAFVDGTRLREVAEQFAKQELTRAVDQEFLQRNVTALFQPEGQMSSELLTFQSILGLRVSRPRKLCVRQSGRRTANR
jgi:hypothetical protein